MSERKLTLSKGELMVMYSLNQERTMELVDGVGWFYQTPPIRPINDITIREFNELIDAGYIEYRTVRQAILTTAGRAALEGNKE